MSDPKTDDLEAVRVVVETIKNFKPDEQHRIFRWVAEKLGLPQPFASSSTSASPPNPPTGPVSSAPIRFDAPHPGGATDIKTFIVGKKPRNDVQFAAAVAYFFRFEAPQAERKEIINKDDLQEAARKVGRERFSNPLQTLSNAHQLGLLDKGTVKATFTINSVGENLVAMALPDGTSTAKPAKKKKAAKPAVKKAQLKKAKKA